ncbi:hypothetical protein ACWGK1_39680 [Streptomyces wedmorensis]
MDATPGAPSPRRRSAVWALAGGLAVCYLAAEAIAHPLYARTALSRRQAAGTA